MSLLAMKKLSASLAQFFRRARVVVSSRSKASVMMRMPSALALVQSWVRFFSPCETLREEPGPKAGSVCMPSVSTIMNFWVSVSDLGAPWSKGRLSIRMW